MRLALIHSPFVGPSTWSLVAGAMRRAHVVRYGGVSAPDWYGGAGRRIIAQADSEAWVAVLHSGAGPIAPSLAAFAVNLHGFIFVDAVLPHPGKSSAEVAPAAQIEQFRAVTSADGLLPKWNHWFPRAILEAWLPNPQTRASVLADIPAVPFEFLQAKAPDHQEWEAMPARFVRLSEGYETNAQRAEERGWPVTRIEANHLAMISHPAKVIAALEVW